MWTSRSNEGLREMYYTARDKCPHVIPKLEDFLKSIISEKNNQSLMKANMEDVLNRFIYTQVFISAKNIYLGVQLLQGAAKRL